MLQRLALALFALLSTMTLAACQTASKDFSRIEKGMEKAEVLDILGSPDRRQRWQGKDRWTYIYYDARTKSEHEIHFQGNIATYVGDKYVPEVSAESQDAFNEASNKEVDARIRKQRADAISNMENYESEVRGSGNVPSFEPVQ